MIIYTCPECGHDLREGVICTYPPIHRTYCPSCSWSWESKREEIQRIPFGGNTIEPAKDYLVAVDHSNISLLNDHSAMTPVLVPYNPTSTISSLSDVHISSIDEKSKLKLIEKLQYRLPGQVSVIPTNEDLALKINEIIEVVNELVGLHTLDKTKEILD